MLIVVAAIVSGGIASIAGFEIGSILAPLPAIRGRKLAVATVRSSSDRDGAPLCAEG